MFYLSIPPNVFVQAAGNAADMCTSRCKVILELFGDMVFCILVLKCSSQHLLVYEMKAV